MIDKCPKCEETLITRTIKKDLGQSSIFIPVAQVCPKCSWNKDLTGAGDIVGKPSIAEVPKPEPMREQERNPPGWTDMNKIVIVVLTLIVLVGIAWAFSPKAYQQQMQEVITPPPVQTPAILTAPAPTATLAPEVTPTGNKIRVKIDRDRGYVIPEQRNMKIKAGDEIIWVNDDSYVFTLVSKDGLFEDKPLDYGKVMTFIFRKTGMFGFEIKVGDSVKFSGTIIVEP